MSSAESLILLNETLCLSGGADGADLQWGMMAGRIGHSVIHWSFNGHKSSAPEVELVRLDDESLAEADEFLKRANLTLKRRFPGKNRFVNNLLRRNFYQTRWAKSFYGVGILDSGRIMGGTAWAAQMYMDRFTHGGESMKECQLYFYDQATDMWMKWDGSWSTTLEVPMPTGVWAGVGTRDLSENGKWAIRNVMGGYVVPSP